MADPFFSLINLLGSAIRKLDKEFLISRWHNKKEKSDAIVRKTPSKNYKKRYPGRLQGILF